MAVASDPRTLAARLHVAGLHAQLAATMHASVAAELGADTLRTQDPAAARRLDELLASNVGHVATNAVNRLVFELLAALDEDPDLRRRLEALGPFC